MANYKSTIIINGQRHETLEDILPANSKQLDILFIGKTPASKSVSAGHYFQGKQGRSFWNRLKEYGILKVLPNTFEDENLLDNNFGLTDIVKAPRDFGNEPSLAEYTEGLNRVLEIMKTHKPQVLFFIYKRVLDKILQLAYGLEALSSYGFNEDIETRFGAKVFVFPMPGTPCTTDAAILAMTELKQFLNR